MAFTWRGDEVLARMKTAASRGVLRAAYLVDAEAKRLILDTPKSGRVYKRGAHTHQASAPGEPPASDTGRLIQSLRVQLAGLTATVSVSAKHGAALEFGTSKMAPRPFLRLALNNKRADCEAAVASEIAKVL